MMRLSQMPSSAFRGFTGPAVEKPQAARFVGGSRVEHRDLEQAHLTIGLEGVAQTDPSLFSLQVFSSILGGGMSSRLFQEVREKRGLCYSIYTFHMPYHDTGFFGLYTGTDPNDAPEMMEVVRRRDQARRRQPDRRRGGSRQGADEGRVVDGDGKLQLAGRAAGAARHRLWTAVDDGRGDRPHRQRQRRIGARGGSCPAVAQPPGGRGTGRGPRS